MDRLEIFLPPFLICVILTGIHGYLGIHVLARHVIFVDLAMAQIAALGTTFAFLLGHDPRSAAAYYVSLGFALVGAAVFSFTRSRRERVPQEAVIGLVYAIATAAGILLADQAAHGTEHLKSILAGSIVWVTWKQIGETFVIYSLLGAFHFFYRNRFLLISSDPESARAGGVNVRLWDFLFYATFGVIITSSVQIAGVLLVFCYLIAPAVFAVQFAEGLGARLALGWTVGVVVSAVGLLFSFDRPSGPTIICFFALFLILSALYRYVRMAERKALALAKAAGGSILCTAIGLLLYGILAPAQEHFHGEPEHALGESTGDLLRALDDEHANVRAEACRKLGDRRASEAIPRLRRLLVEDAAAQVKENAAMALSVLGAKEAIPELREEAGKQGEDEWVQLRAVQALVRLEDPEAIPLLFRLSLHAQALLVRREASSLLLGATGDGSPSSSEADRANRLAELWERWKKAGERAFWDPEGRVFRF